MSVYVHLPERRYVCTWETDRLHRSALQAFRQTVKEEEDRLCSSRLSFFFSLFLLFFLSFVLSLCLLFLCVSLFDLLLCPGLREKLREVRYKPPAGMRRVPWIETLAVVCPSLRPEKDEEPEGREKKTKEEEEQDGEEDTGNAHEKTKKAMKRNSPSPRPPSGPGQDLEREQWLYVSPSSSSDLPLSFQCLFLPNFFFPFSLCFFAFFRSRPLPPSTNVRDKNRRVFPWLLYPVLKTQECGVSSRLLCSSCCSSVSYRHRKRTTYKER